MLRPRTGSGKTQDRVASGGVLVEQRHDLLSLLADDERRRRYVAYPRVNPAVHEAAVVIDGETHALERAVSEIAAYGVFAADADGRVLSNSYAGCGARTRPANPRHPLSAILGYGALSTCELTRRT